MLLLALGAATWAVLSLRNENSILSILVRDARNWMPWADASTTWGVLRKMSWYQERGRYDDAIKTGIAWTEKHPKDGSNAWLFRSIALLYLERAKKDTAHTDEYVRQAVLYRENALPFDVDDVSALRDLALFAEAAGDLSRNQRCSQYGYTIKVLERLEDVLRERRTVAPKEEAFVAPRKGTSAEYVLTVEDIDALVEQTDRTISRVRQKLQRSACH